MAQLHIYVPDALAERLKTRADDAGLSLSKYSATVVAKEAGADEWPPGYFEKVLGRWKGSLERPPQSKFEKRDSFD